MSGLRQPAEFEPQDGLWLSWPHREDDWPGKLEAVRWAFAELVRLAAQEVVVHLLVHDAEVREDAHRRLSALPIPPGRLQLLELPTDRGWMRDIAPALTFDAAGRCRAVCWRFDGWSRYPEHRLDAAVARELCRLHDLPPLAAEHRGQPVVMEGGAYDLNGRGSALVTRECLLDQGPQCRNPDFEERDYQQVFQRLLGAGHLIWLPGGIAGDDTHGHVDDVARFVGPRQVLCAVQDDPADPDHEPLAANLAALRAARDQQGRPLEVLSLPVPGPVLFEGERLPASYANFLFCGGAVIVPTFNDPNDRVALERIALATGRRVVGLHASDLVLGYGTVHCLSHQVPARPRETSA